MTKQIMFFWIFCILIIWSCSSFAQNENQHFVCKQVSSIFDADNQSVSNVGNQACAVVRPGKRGPAGIQGLPGPRGPPGIVDYDEINATIQETIQDLKRKLQCADGVVVGQTCYKLPYRAGVAMNYATAKSFCSFLGGELAEIPTAEAYFAVYNYVQKNWYVDIEHPRSTVVRVWLDSSYQSPGQVFLKNGTRGFVRWHPIHPIEGVRRTRIAIHVSTQPADSGGGMFLDTALYSVSIVPLCQFSIV